MDSRLAARLERLRVLVKDDLAALPDRPPSPAPSDIDEEPAGGVSLDPPADDAASPSPTSSSKQPLSPEVVTAEAKPEPAPATNGHTTWHENTERRFVLVQGAESSHNLGSQPKFSAPPAVRLPPTDLQRSQLSPPLEKYFTPIVALSKYPYRFCNKDCMQDIASAFFDQRKFWAREWDLYYVWDIDESKPLILVRESQVDTLLTEINFHLKLQLKITHSQREEGLVSRFPDHPRCRPRYLGRSHNRDEYDSMVDQVPGVGVRAPGEPVPPPLDGPTLEDFKQMIEEAWDVQRNKTKANKEKKRVERLNKQKVFTDQLKRAQRYLGLRPTAVDGQPALGAPPAVDVSLSAPFPYDRSVVLVCVDVEAYERDHNKITEIGVATLDTRDLVDVAPGQDGENWRSKIQARHFRITEYAHLVNSEFVSGCPDSFFFGQSERVSLKDAPALVAACFRSPFCAEPGQRPEVEGTDQGEKRSLIFLGHDTLTDVKYLQKMGFDPLSLPNLLEAQDSANLYRVWKRDQQITSLGRILGDFDIAGFGLHNAGNDAVYTVQAFLSICVREASIRNSPKMQEFRSELTQSKLSLAQEELKQDIENDAKGWEALEAEGDGGEPVPLEIKKEAVPATAPAPVPDAPLQPTTNGTPASNNVGGRGRGHGRGKDVAGHAQRGRGREYNHQTPNNFDNRPERGNSQFRPSTRGRAQYGGVSNDRSQTVSRSFGQGRSGRSRGRGSGRARGSLTPGTFLRYDGSSFTATDGGFPAPEPVVDNTDGWGGPAPW